MDLYSSSLGVGEVGLYLFQTDEEADQGQDQVDQAEEVGGQLHPPQLLGADCHLGPHSMSKQGMAMNVWEDLDMEIKRLDWCDITFRFFSLKTDTQTDRHCALHNK